MPARHPELKYFQVGSWAAGNRLVGPEQRSVQAQPERFNAITCGHRACQGCGEALGARWALEAALAACGGDAITVNATGCLEVFSTPYPETAWQVPWMHSLFANAAAVASGVASALAVQANTHTRVIAQGGDGATVDIGFAGLSGMFERGDDVLYLCYDNEGYMNTGVQRSASTPPAAATMTTPALGPAAGAPWGQGKNAALIALAHEIPYVATATVADLRDLEAKVTYAMSLHGPRYIHILTPCPLGWKTAAGDSVKVARLAVQSGLFPVWEGEHGEVTATSPIRRRVPVEAYLEIQGRFSHLFRPVRDEAVLARIQARADHNIARFHLLEAAEAR